MRQVVTSRFSFYLTALLFSMILSACGGGAQNIGNSDLGNSGGGNPSPTPTPTPPNNDPLPTATKSVSLSWNPPLYYTNGDSLDDLKGHNIYMKTGSGSFVKIYTLNTTAIATHLVENLSPGTYTFAVTAFNTGDIESSFSQTVTVTL